MKPVRPVHTVLARHRARRPYRWSGVAALAALALALASCGSSGGSSSSSTPTTAGHAGGVFTILANSNFGVADPAQNYTLEEWPPLTPTHNGPVGFAKVTGAGSTKIRPEPAETAPSPSNRGQTHLAIHQRGTTRTH